MFKFISFIAWSQWLLLCDLIQGLFTGKFDCSEIERKLSDYLKINIIPLDSSSQVHSATRVVFSNHRSFTDFFLDPHLIGGGSHLARYLMAFVLPMCGIYGPLTGRGIFFIRARTKRADLSKKIVNHLQRYSKPLIIYPEGTRYLGIAPTALKYGMIKTCYEYNLPCQILMSAGKENVLQERAFLLQFDQACVYELTQPIFPSDFSSYEDFYAEVTLKWNESWEKTFSEWEKRCSPPQSSLS